MAAPQYMLYTSKGYSGSRVASAYALAIAETHPGAIEEMTISQIPRARLPSYIRGTPVLVKYEKPGKDGPSLYEGKYCIQMLQKLSGGKTLADLGMNDVRLGGSRATPRSGPNANRSQPKMSEGGLREIDSDIEDDGMGGGGGGDSKYDNLF